MILKFAKFLNAYLNALFINISEETNGTFFSKKLIIYYHMTRKIHGTRSQLQFHKHNIL